mmetsp:Transcript_9248/g.15721  ORF Transcript_9248/g.15721 Transcript_9248/m.15721 type:complete len:272 (-) Transcript_9248:87-902(-)
MPSQDRSFFLGVNGARPGRPAAALAVLDPTVRRGWAVSPAGARRPLGPRVWPARDVPWPRLGHCRHLLPVRGRQHVKRHVKRHEHAAAKAARAVAPHRAPARRGCRPLPDVSGGRRSLLGPVCGAVYRAARMGAHLPRPRRGGAAARSVHRPVLPQRHRRRSALCDARRDIRRPARVSSHGAAAAGGARVREGGVDVAALGGRRAAAVGGRLLAFDAPRRVGQPRPPPRHAGHGALRILRRRQQRQAHQGRAGGRRCARALLWRRPAGLAV